ncbi:uncharacterized protein LOC132730853 [Ruditapes philippinarum]|uniref:uncharacterized protein LOC132730853 n=1 Tax=Ruditapes philippinarum TaxID=129788 RepID=UPI00295BDEBC|nr:uncharacterized protein LOC132730853 [Ruditapes philippinarum]
MCDNGCCGNSPDKYCCATSSYIAYIIVAAILLSVLAVLLIALWYKKKTVSRRRTGPSGISIRMTEDRPSNLPRACIDGTDRRNFNYYHLQWVFGQPMAPPPYYVDSASAYGTHASDTIGGNTSGRIVEWQQHQNTNEYNRTIGNNSPPPPYSI